MKKILRNVMAALLVLPLLVSVFGVATVNADDAETVDVTVNKRIWTDESAPSEILNTGAQMDFGGEALNGVTFTVYDVTDAYYDLHATTPNTKTVIDTIASDLATYAGEDNVVASKVTEGAGQATFRLRELQFGEDPAVFREAAYLFVETATPANVSVTKKAAPFVLVMPLYEMNPNGTFTPTKLPEVHVYPKNETVTDTKEVVSFDGLDLITEDGTVYRNVEIGQKIPFKLTLNIPEDIAEVESYSVTDTPTLGLAYADGTLQVEGLQAGDYTFTTNDNGGFTIELSLESETVKALAGKQLVITYQMALTKEALPDTPYENGAAVTIGGNDPQETIKPKDPENPENPVKFITGGKRFIKTDAHTELGLGEAEFVVKNGNQFAVFTNNEAGEYAFIEWSDEAVDNSKVVSAENTGAFNIIGLKYGTYTLSEVGTPNGYVPIADLEFDVVYNGYNAENGIRNVPNTPKGLLPSTGGNGIYAFLAVGALLMIGSYIWFKKSKVQAEV